MSSSWPAVINLGHLRTVSLSVAAGRALGPRTSQASLTPLTTACPLSVAFPCQAAWQRGPRSFQKKIDSCLFGNCLALFGHQPSPTDVGAKFGQQKQRPRQPTVQPPRGSDPQASAAAARVQHCAASCGYWPRQSKWKVTVAQRRSHGGSTLSEARRKTWPAMPPESLLPEREPRQIQALLTLPGGQAPGNSTDQPTSLWRLFFPLRILGTICEAWCRMKMWGPLLKTYKESQDGVGGALNPA